MKLKELAGPLPLDGVSSAAVEVTGVTSDSRQVKPGMIFVAVPGTKAALPRRATYNRSLAVTLGLFSRRLS